MIVVPKIIIASKLIIAPKQNIVLRVILAPKEYGARPMKPATIKYF